MSTDLENQAADSLRKALTELDRSSINATPGAAMAVAATAYALAVARGDVVDGPNLSAVKSEYHKHGLFG